MPISFQCAKCKHFEFAGMCEAFLEGIPAEILTGEHDHREPYKGDGDIQFEPIDGESSD